jgi:hypothetical protein
LFVELFELVFVIVMPPLPLVAGGAAWTTGVGLTMSISQPALRSARISGSSLRILAYRLYKSIDNCRSADSVAVLVSCA